MFSDKDRDLALQLQAQFDEEAMHEHAGNPSRGSVIVDTSSFGTIAGSSSNSKVGNAFGAGSGPATEEMSIVDEQWELLDPSPDMRAMFLEFNDKYFWGRLAGVEVRWSPRMTLCAGLCCYEGHGGMCSIRLSSPLLKLRPRKDLVETLLHEMIHAYLFVTANNKDHDGHGPEFCKHMDRLNKSTGSSISIYHNFHDEVDVYRQHWWRCDGPCQKRPPYHGVVRRAMNRAPSPRDPWWAQHQSTCGGSYTKVKEPEGYGIKKRGGKRKNINDGVDIGNEAKKRATGEQEELVGSSFPGKGNSIGGTATSSRLIPQNTLDKFLRKIEVPIGPSVPPASTRAESQCQDESGSESGKENRSKSSRLRALAAIFDSDSDDDDDIIIVKVNKQPLENDDAHHVPHSHSHSGTSLASPRLTTDIGSKDRNNPAAGRPPSSVTKPNLNVNSTSGSLSNHRGSAKRDPYDMKQDSIVDAFSRMRQRSGDGLAKNGGCASPSKGNNSSTEDTIGTNRQDGRPSVETVDCPVCGLKVEQSQINRHLDQCLA